VLDRGSTAKFAPVCAPTSKTQSGWGFELPTSCPQSPPFGSLVFTIAKPPRGAVSGDLLFTGAHGCSSTVAHPITHPRSLFGLSLVTVTRLASFDQGDGDALVTNAETLEATSSSSGWSRLTDSANAAVST
jgi:hypothetical protein